MTGAIEMGGQKFGRLVVRDRAGTSKGGQAVWACVCECGNLVNVLGSQLRREGGTRSCGCLKKDASSLANTTHGHARRSATGNITSPTYQSYTAMLARCYNPKHEAFHNYGGRGIIVCDRWRTSFANFLADMGERPARLTLERRDNAGNYEPANAKWVTRKEQCNNRRGNRIVTFKAIAATLAEWEEITGIPQTKIRYRLEKGWSVRDALMTGAAL